MERVPCAGGVVEDGERTWLELARASHLGLYEILAVRPDEGFTLRDLWSNAEIRVRERLGPRQLVRWDLVGARVIEGPEQDLVFEALPYVYPPEMKETLLDELRRRHRQLAKGRAHVDLTGFFKQAALVMHHLWLMSVAFPPPLKVQTVEGDPVVFTRVVFDVHDRAAVRDALLRHVDIVLSEDDDDHLVWFEPGQGDQRRNLAHIELKAGRLTLNAMSRERAERGRRLVEELAGDLVRYRTTRLDPVERLIQRGRTGRAAARRGGPGASLTPPRRARHRLPPSGLSPEVEAEVTREFLDRHYHEWLDQPIPALGNRTPRHAARLKTVRPKLIELLKAMDNRAERDRLEGRVAYDAGWIWEQLGVERG